MIGLDLEPRQALAVLGRLEQPDEAALRLFAEVEACMATAVLDPGGPVIIRRHPSPCAERLARRALARLRRRARQYTGSEILAETPSRGAWDIIRPFSGAPRMFCLVGFTARKFRQLQQADRDAATRGGQA